MRLTTLTVPHAHHFLTVGGGIPGVPGGPDYPLKHPKNQKGPSHPKPRKFPKTKKADDAKVHLPC